MRFAFFTIAVLCTGCISDSELSDRLLTLPDTSLIERPDNADADAMLDVFLDDMDSIFLVGEMYRLRARDSYARRVFIEAFSDPDLDPNTREAFQTYGGEYISQIDEINTAELKSLLAGMDWRTLVSKKGNHFDSAFLIVQHTNDYEYQESVLEELKPLAEEGLIDGGKFALMYDRVELRSSGSQLYGTQAECVDGQQDIVNLIEPATIDERRSEMGMEPLSEYLAQLRDLYGPC